MGLSVMPNGTYTRSLMIDAQTIDRALAIFGSAKRLCCICHKNPDGDAIGALTGVAQLLEERFPATPVELYCADLSPDTFRFISFSQRILQDLQPKDGDAFVFVDCAVPKQTDFHETHPKLFDGSYPSVNIDHHQDNALFATVNIVVPDAASSCEIVVAIADQSDWPLSAEVATALLTGVYTDTGGLLHSNTTAQVYRTVARLLRAGARQQTIVQRVFRTSKISTLKLWGRVLEKISLSDEGAAISALTEGDFKATGADYSELTGAIDYVNAVPGMKFSLILSERGGKVKGSLRTLRDDVNVAEMAKKFDGGGHKKAAGFALTGKLQQEVRWKVQEQ